MPLLVASAVWVVQDAQAARVEQVARIAWVEQAARVVRLPVRVRFEFG